MKEFNTKKKPMFIIVNILMSILFVMSTMITIALAATKFSLNMGGYVVFEAKDVQATISKGVITNGTVGEDKMKAIVLTPDDDGRYEKSSWSGLQIKFESKNDVTIEFSVTNDHPEKSLSVDITPTFENASNMEMKVEVNNKIINTTRVIVPSVKDNVMNCRITFHINNQNQVGNIRFSIEYDLEMTDESVPAYERVNEKGELDKNGKYLLFGQYPQTIKADNVTIGDRKNGYYLGSDGELYAELTAFPNEMGIEDYTFSDGKIVEEGETYYFKLEKLKWRFLDENENGEALILCDTIIDGGPGLGIAWQDDVVQEGEYYYAAENGEIILDEEGEPVFANDYRYSDAREFLNGYFLQEAFSIAERKHILPVEIYLNGTFIYDDVSLLGLDTVNSDQYGFINNYYTPDIKDPQKVFMTSDYSRANGCLTITPDFVEATGEEFLPYIGSGVGWLMNSDGDMDYGIGVCFMGAGIGYIMEATTSSLGFIPAMYVQL